MTKQKKIILGVGLTGLGTLGFFYWKLRREEAEESEGAIAGLIQKRLRGPITMQRRRSMAKAPPGLIHREKVVGLPPPPPPPPPPS